MVKGRRVRRVGGMGRTRHENVTDEVYNMSGVQMRELLFLLCLFVGGGGGVKLYGL